MQSSSRDSRSEVLDLWQNSSADVKFIAYKLGLSEQTVRNTVRGRKGAPKERRTLSQFHRALGLRVVDKRLATRYTKQAFAQAHGLSHVRLSDIEKGYHDITIAEIINLGLFDTVAGMDTSLLGND